MIVDTSVIVAAIERRRESAIAALRDLGRPATRSFVVDGELAAGVEAARMLGLAELDVEMRAATRDAYWRLSEPAPRLDVDVLAAHFGHVTAVASTAKVKAGQNDRWILAEALTLGERVLTADAAMHQLGALITSPTPDGAPLTTLVDG